MLTLLAALLLFSAPVSAQTVSTDAVSGMTHDAPADAPAEKPAKKARVKKAKEAAAAPEPAKPKSHKGHKAAANPMEEKPSAEKAAEAKPAEEKPAEAPPAEEKAAPVKKRKDRKARKAEAKTAPKAEAKPAEEKAPDPQAPPVPAEPAKEEAKAPPPPPEPVVPVLDVVWPKEKDAFPAVTRSFVFGKANPGAELTVNGQTLQVLPSGAFFAMVPFSTGTFNLDFESKFSGIAVSTRRVVQVAPAAGPDLKPGEVLVLEPAEDVEARPGELLVVRCKGAPGGEATFSVGKAARDVAMAESTPTASGLYEGHLYLPAWDRRDPLEVQCRVKGKGGGKAVGTAKVTILDPGQTRVGLTTGRNTILKSSEQGYTLFLNGGIRLEVTGRRGGMAHVRLSEHEDGWVEAKGLAMQSAGVVPPRAVVGRYITTKVTDRAVRLSVSASERVAYEVRQTVEPLGFKVRFFNARQRFDRMRFDSADAVVKDVRWRQDDAEVVEMDVDTRLQWGWGYSYGYEDGGNFYLEIRRPPDLTKVENVLAGRRIVVDPGHGPETGAVGPLGTTERETNMSIAAALEGLLIAEGAEVTLTRRSPEGPGLAERPWLAQEAKGDLFVSVHNNALPVTADPAEVPRGYMHFYYHPQSRKLAEFVEEAYRRRHPDLPDEGLRWGDLAVCRGPFMPAILTESAYVILPEQEEKLRSGSYQRKLAGTILEGVKDYLKEYQRLQKRSPEERAAAAVRR